MDLIRYVRVQWDRTVAIAATVGGVVLLLTGYFGVSDTEYIAEQIPFVVGDGFGAIFLLTIGAVLWISSDLRDEWRELRAQGQVLRREEAERRNDLEAYVDAAIARQLAASRSVQAGVPRP